MARKKVERAGKTRSTKTRGRISLVAGILLGLTLLASGTGKIFASGGASAQILDFIGNVVPAIFLTPATIDFLINILIPHAIPWAEFILGACLLIGFLPRLMAVLCLPLLAAFMGTNLWAVTQGGYATCASCFGIWEEFFGSLTPVQSLIYDLALFAFAILIIVFHPGKFLTSRPWLANLSGGKELNATMLKSKILELWGYLRNLGSKASGYLSPIGGKARQHPYITLVAGICLVGLVAYGIVAAFAGAAPKNGPSQQIAVISEISTEVSETGATISWMTDNPTTSNVEVSTTGDGVSVITVSDKNLVTAHRITIGGLSPDTTYYFKILSDDKEALSSEHSFKTLAPVTSPFAVFDVKVSEITESNAIITWVTNRMATSEVEYWASGSRDRLTASNDKLAISHSINLAPLEADAIYYYQVKSTDASGNQAISPISVMSSQIGKRAPDFTLNSLDGKPVTLSDYRGKVVMLDFWIWTCSACQKKLSIIQEASAKIPLEKVAIFAIHFEGKESVIQSYAISEGFTIPILLDLEAKVNDLYKVYEFPTTFFIDRDGITRMINVEFNSVEELENIFNIMLGTK